MKFLMISFSTIFLSMSVAITNPELVQSSNKATVDRKMSAIIEMHILASKELDYTQKLYEIGSKGFLDTLKVYEHIDKSTIQQAQFAHKLQLDNVKELYSNSIPRHWTMEQKDARADSIYWGTLDVTPRRKVIQPRRLATHNEIKKVQKVRKYTR